MIRRLSLFGLLTAMGLAIAAPSYASAATTIGVNFPAPTSACGTNETDLQTSSPNNQYAAPSDGVITSWTFEAGSPAPSSLKLKVARSAGGDNFQIVGESPVKSPTANATNTYTDVQIPVRAGDVLGYWADGPTSWCGRFAAGYSFRFRIGDVLPGTTESFGSELENFQIDFSARLEPDCDKDGLGDETQDPDTSSCKATGQRAAALKKCKKKAKKKHWSKKRLKKCKKKARLLPV